MGKELFTTKQFIDAIPGTGGIITTIAERVGCVWHTAKKYIDTYPTIRKAYIDECERVTDMAESILIKSIKDGNTQDAKWWLARKRKTVFGDAVDITSGGHPILRVDWDELGDSD